MTVNKTNYDLKDKDRDDLVLISPLITEVEKFDSEINKIYWNIKKELEDAVRLHEEYLKNNKQ